MPTRPLTKDHLDAVIQDLARHFNKSVSALGKRMDNRFDQVDQRFEQVDNQFLEINTKLEAIMSGEVLVTRKQFSRLFQPLKSRGIILDEDEILAS